MQVIKILEVLSGKIILQNSNLPNSKINFATKTKMPREEAVSAFESLLSLNGIAIIPLGEKYLKAVPSDAVNTQAPQFIMGKPSDLPVSLNFYTKLFELQYMPLEKLNDRLKPFLSSAKVASAELFPRSNSILITDTLANLQRVELLLEQLDRPAQIRVRVFIARSRWRGRYALRGDKGVEAAVWLYIRSVWRALGKPALPLPKIWRRRECSVFAAPAKTRKSSAPALPALLAVGFGAAESLGGGSVDLACGSVLRGGTPGGLSLRRG